MSEYEATGERLVDLGSDQTSCHNPFNGGYYPVQLTFDQANDLMVNDPVRFKNLVQERSVCVCLFVCLFVCFWCVFLIHVILK